MVGETQTASSDVRNRVFKIVSQVFKMPLENISEDSSPDQIAKWDSLEHMNLILALEEAFKVQFEAEQIGQMQSVGLILLTLKEKGIS
jgi:acyl carrier protein